MDYYEPEIEYTVLRYDEDYSYLENPVNRIELLDSIKYIPLFGGRPDCYLSLGGELREQYEFIQNDNFGLGSVNNSGCWLERLMLHSDWHFGPFVRAFVQFKSELEEGRKPGPRPPDRKRLDLNQAFVDFSYPRTNPSSNTTSFTLRLGRQEVDFGDERLIAVREGANSRQSFDGARFIYYSPKARVDAFALQLDPDRPGYFDNDPSQSHRTCGACTQPSRSLPSPPPPSLTISPWIFSILAFTMATPDSTMVLGTKLGTRWEAVTESSPYQRIGF